MIIFMPCYHLARCCGAASIEFVRLALASSDHGIIGMMRAVGIMLKACSYLDSSEEYISKKGRDEETALP